jgi:anti-sigma factor RsiW
MICQSREKVGLYVDGEMEPAMEQAFAAHLQSCPDCSAAVVEQQGIKTAVRRAGKRFSAPPDLYASVRKQIHSRPTARPWQRWIAVAASTALLAVIAFGWFSRSGDQGGTITQLIDQHVTMLASANPVDVISEDRHTVKPWFQGKLPFTFNLPELANSDFKLLGGKLVYAHHSPGAELIYQVRQHKISVFIFQSRDVGNESPSGSNAFTVNGWHQGGLQFYVVTDAAGEDAGRLRELMKQANHS